MATKKKKKMQDHIAHVTFEGESRKDIQLQQLELLHHMLASGPFIIPPPVPSETLVCKVIAPTDPAGCYSITTLRKDGSLHGASFSTIQQSKKKVYFSEVLNMALQSAPALDDFEAILEYRQTLLSWCTSLQHHIDRNELLRAYDDYVVEARQFAHVVPEKEVVYDVEYEQQLQGYLVRMRASWSGIVSDVRESNCVGAPESLTQEAWLALPSVETLRQQALLNLNLKVKALQDRLSSLGK